MLGPKTDSVCAVHMLLTLSPHAGRWMSDVGSNASALYSRCRTSLCAFIVQSFYHCYVYNV